MAFSGFTSMLSLDDETVERATVRWSSGFKCPVIEFGDLMIVAHDEGMAALLRRLADEVEAACVSRSEVA